MSVIGVPIKVLHEAEGHIVTVETTTGEVSLETGTRWHPSYYYSKERRLLPYSLTAALPLSLDTNPS